MLTDRFGGVLIARAAAVCAVLGFVLVAIALDAWAALAGFAVVGSWDLGHGAAFTLGRRRAP